LLGKREPILKSLLLISSQVNMKKSWNKFHHRRRQPCRVGWLKTPRPRSMAI